MLPFTQGPGAWVVKNPIILGKALELLLVAWVVKAADLQWLRSTTTLPPLRAAHPGTAPQGQLHTSSLYAYTLVRFEQRQSTREHKD